MARAKAKHRAADEDRRNPNILTETTSILTRTHGGRLLFVLFLLYVVDYGDRTLIGAMAPTLKHVFHINNAQLGLLTTATNVVGAVAAIPAGILVDRVNRTNLAAGSLVLWAAALAVVGAATSYLMLLGSRLLLGVVTAVSGPIVPSIIGDTMPIERRVHALSFIEAGQLIGTGFGLLIGALATAFLTFRYGFWGLAAGGLVLAFLFWRVGEPPRSHSPELSAETPETESPVERMVRERHIAPSKPAILHRSPARMTLLDAVYYVIRVRTFALVLVARSVGDYFLAGVSTFAVLFATKQYRISESMADIALLVLGVGALAGIAVVGGIGSRLLRAGYLNGRLWLAAAGYGIGPVIILPALLTRQLAVGLPLICLGAFFIAGAAPPLDAVRIDVLVPSIRGRCEGVREVFRTVAEGGAPAFFGVLSGVLAGGHRAGLQLALLLTLPGLTVAAILLVIATRWYGPDVAAALRSVKEQKNTG